MVEEFTFPRVFPPEQYCCDGAGKLLPFPRFGGASPPPPPPWFVVSSAGAVHDHRRCFSAVVEHDKARDGDGDGRCYRRGSERFAASAAASVVEEHKMDMLWEDFNDEILARAAAPPCPISKEWESEAWLPGDVAVPSGAGNVVRRRRLSLMTMVKLLKKLFLARKSKATSSLPQGGRRRHQND